MKAKNFRIGNVIKYDNRIFTIDTIAEEFPTLDTIELGTGVVDWNNIELIELTEDWLIKLGFMDIGNDDFLVSPPTKHIPCFKAGINKYKGLFSWANYVLTEIEIEYVHELQNLFFALTRKELTMKAEISACS